MWEERRRGIWVMGCESRIGAAEEVGASVRCIDLGQTGIYEVDCRRTGGEEVKGSHTAAAWTRCSCLGMATWLGEHIGLPLDGLPRHLVFRLCLSARSCLDRHALLHGHLGWGSDPCCRSGSDGIPARMVDCHSSLSSVTVSTSRPAADSSYPAHHNSCSYPGYLSFHPPYDRPAHLSARMTVISTVTWTGIERLAAQRSDSDQPESACRPPLPRRLAGWHSGRIHPHRQRCPPLPRPVQASEQVWSGVGVKARLSRSPRSRLVSPP